MQSFFKSRLRDASVILLATKQAAIYLGLSPYTLEKWRTQGIGPRFVRLGAKAIRYRKSDLDAFIDGGENG